MAGGSQGTNPKYSQVQHTKNVLHGQASFRSPERERRRRDRSLSVRLLGRGLRGNDAKTLELPLPAITSHV